MSANQSPPKRPRLSLQIKAISSGPNLRASRTIAAVVNPTSPTSFNTLSNVYATAIDRSTPVTAINTKQPLKLQTQNLTQPQKAAQTPHAAPASFGSTLPDTPLTAQPLSPTIASLQDVRFPSSMTATPPLSAGPVDSSSENKMFSFTQADTAASTLSAAAPSTISTTPTIPTANTPIRRRATASLCVSRPALSPPYVRNRSLHSILRNSPLPPPTAKTPISPRRQSARLADKASRRVCYESPIEHVITNDQYVRSHIDLLLDHPSPLSASPISPSTAIDETMRDGGMTPGPFEEMRRRMAGLGTTRTTTTTTTTTPASPVAGSPTGIRKRRRKERSRRWVWTIGTQEGDEDEAEVGGAIAALRAAARTQQTGAAAGGASPVTPMGTKPSPLPLVMVEPMMESPMEIVTPSIETFDEAGEAAPDVLMYESEPDAETSGLVPDQRRALSLTPGDMDYEMVTPTVAGNSHLQPFFARSIRQDSEGMFNPETGSRRDTPVPADLVVATE